MKKVWVEKFRPKSVDKIIMPSTKYRKIFKSFVDTGEIPNILMSGGPGTGKTSMSLALIRDLDVDKMDVLKINCSDEKIDALRDKVKGFATTMPIGKFKVVRLEEIDGIGHDAQKLLRSLMEDVSDTCRFIATCNYINLIHPPLRSRFQEFSITAPAREDVIVLAAEILEAENIQFEIDDVEQVVAAAYPDVRKMIHLLEGSSTSGKLDLSSDDRIHDWKLDLLPALSTSDLKAARKIVCESASPEEIAEVFTFLYQNVSRIPALKNLEDEAIVIINEYQHKHVFVADKELNAAALFIELFNLTK